MPRLLEDDILINSKLIRPGLIEAVFPLAEDLYMVSYFIMQKDCIIASCCLDDLLDREALDKIWKDLEKSDAKAPKARMKEYFGVESLVL